jgi:hypothetical protein
MRPERFTDTGLRGLVPNHREGVRLYDEDEYDEYPGYPEYTQQRVPRRYYAETVGNVLQALTEYTRTLEKEKSSRADIERKRETALWVIRSHTVLASGANSMSGISSWWIPP